MNPRRDPDWDPESAGDDHMTRAKREELIRLVKRRVRGLVVGLRVGGVDDPGVSVPTCWTCDWPTTGALAVLLEGPHGGAAVFHAGCLVQVVEAMQHEIRGLLDEDESGVPTS
jgi:hypothetical protein